MSGEIYLFKIVILGESQVGKSSLMKRLCDGTFTETLRFTSGVADRRREIEVLNRKISLHIWDTAGQEKYRGINRMYYRGASGAIFVFDITSNESFLKLESWLKEFKQEVADGEIILVGNKLDLEEKREVPQDVARNFALRNGMFYIETSAKNDTGVLEAFSKLGENILAKMLCKNNPNVKCEGSRTVLDGKKTKSGKGCC
jgi:small GTP-binding protein